MSTLSGRNKRATLCMLICMCMVPVFAQQKKFTLSELVDSAKIYLPQVSVKNAQLGFSQAAVVDTRHLFLQFVRFNEQVNLATDNSVAGSIAKRR